MSDLKIDELIERIEGDDDGFASVYPAIKDRTIVGSHGCYMIYRCVKRAEDVPGAFAEIGVYRGGTAKLIARACPGRELHLFDTFTGIPDTAIDTDHHRPGEFGDTSLEAVSDYLSDCSNVHIHAGVFPGSAGPVREKEFAFVYVDSDIYRSVRDCVEFFYPRLTPGGVMLFDDYGWWKCPGVKVAVDDYLAGLSGGFVCRSHAYTLDQAVLVKTGDEDAVPHNFPFHD